MKKYLVYFTYSISAAGLQFFGFFLFEYYMCEGILTKIFGEFLNFAPMNLHVGVIIHGCIYIYEVHTSMFICMSGHTNFVCPNGSRSVQ